MALPFKEGSVSKIEPRLNTISTDSRLDVDYIVTEYGYCQLMGKSTN
ncbi:acetyl-CoA hydrolase/transferase C-terminal domain-containing protein [Microbulbifer sp. DLAB2-AA]